MPTGFYAGALEPGELNGYIKRLGDQRLKAYIVLRLTFQASHFRPHIPGL
jgi:hypothetical protein